MLGSAILNEELFQMASATKSYGGVQALKNASISLRPGRIHAVLGENGAGKSTLIKMMSGVVQPDSGSNALRSAAKFNFVRPPRPCNMASCVCFRNCRWCRI